MASTPFVPPNKENIVVKQLRRGIWGLVWICVSLGAVIVPAGLRAEDAVKPVMVLSVANVDRLMDDFAYLTRLSGRGDVGGRLQLLIDSLIEDFDRTQPAGVLITIDQGQPKGIGFLPVPDADQALLALKGKLGLEVDDLGGGIKKLAFGKGAYLKQQGKWLFFTDRPQNLSQLPDDPVAMLDGLDKRYDVALRFYVQNIPQGVRDVADYAIQTGIDADLNAKQSADPDIDKVLLETLRKSLKKCASTLINESDQVTVGWAVDSQQRRTYVDLQATAVDGSSLSQQLASLVADRSEFTGFFLEDAAAAFEGSLNVSPQAQQQIDTLLKYVRTKIMKGMDADPNVPPDVKEIAGNVLDVVDRTLQQGKADVGATLVLAPESFKFVAGVRVADGKALATAFQRLFELAKHQPNIPEIQFYAEKIGDLDLHTLALPIAENDGDGRRLLGENVDITIATGPESLYFAFGKGSGSLLRTVAERRGGPGAPEAGSDPSACEAQADDGLPGVM